MIVDWGKGVARRSPCPPCAGKSQRWRTHRTQKYPSLGGSPDLLSANPKTERPGAVGGPQGLLGTQDIQDTKPGSRLHQGPGADLPELSTLPSMSRHRAMTQLLPLDKPSPCLKPHSAVGREKNEKSLLEC